jgi:hypothetical protein
MKHFKSPQQAQRFLSVFELWIGDAAQITAMRVRKQKTDRQDAQFLLKLLLEDRFPECGRPARRIGISGNYCGIAIDWYRCAHGS